MSRLRLWRWKLGLEILLLLDLVMGWIDLKIFKDRM